MFPNFIKPNFKKIVHEQHSRKEKDYPVAVAGINVSQVLYTLFTDSTGIFNILFDHKNAFEEIYFICLKLLDTTWDEMDASYMDFPKVLAAVKSRILEGLSNNPISIDQFKRAATWKGNKAQQTKEQTIVQKELIESDSIKQLRQQFTSETLSLIKESRKSLLKNGSWFKTHKSTNANDSEFLFARLKKDVLEYAYAQNQATIPSTLLSLTKGDISTILPKNQTPYFAKMKKLSPSEEEISNLSFSLLLKDTKSIDFIAKTTEEYEKWTNGLSLFYNDVFMSDSSLPEIKNLVNIQLGVLLLETEGYTLPQTAPEIPNPPSNFTFAAK